MDFPFIIIWTSTTILGESGFYFIFIEIPESKLCRPRCHVLRRLIWVYTVCLCPKIGRQAYMSRLVTQPTKWHVRPAKTQISLGIRPVWSESLLCVQCVAKGPSFHHADGEDSDQTWRMPRLIWVFTGRTCHFVGFVMRRLILVNNNGVWTSVFRDSSRRTSFNCHIKTESRHGRTCLQEFPTKSDSNQPAQPQKLARGLKFRL